jgi:hypothetical protein
LLRLFPGGRVMAARVGHSLGASIHHDLARVREWIEEARTEARNPARSPLAWRRSLAHWRQCFAVSAAAQRAHAGDETARRRLAWRELVLKGRRTRTAPRAISATSASGVVARSSWPS